MIRKQTWILLIVLAVLVGAIFYLQKNPLPSNSTATPSPTAAPALLEGWTSEDIVWMQMESSQSGSEPVILSLSADGTWVLGKDGKQAADAGKVEQARAQIADLHPTAALPQGTDLKAIGLTTPNKTLTVKNVGGKSIKIQIGSATPTGSGYYVSVDGKAPVVVAQTVIDTLEGLFVTENLLPPTPTAVVSPSSSPETTSLPAETATLPALTTPPTETAIETATVTVTAAP
jgi:hypothetical protein